MTPDIEKLTAKLRNDADVLLSPATLQCPAPNLSATLIEAADALASLARERDALRNTTAVTRADLSAGWEIVGLPRLGRHICWVTDPKELAPTLAALLDSGTLVASVLPVASLRRSLSSEERQ